MIISIALLVWAVICLFIVLFFIASKRSQMPAAPKPEPNPTPEQVQGVMETYEILGMYEGLIQ